MDTRHNKIVMTILTISLLFNIFFVGGYLYSRSVEDKLLAPNSRARLIAKRLNLNEHQLEVFIEISSQYKQKAEQLKQSSMIEIEAFWEELITKNSDDDKINELSKPLLEKHKEFRALSIDAIIDFCKILTPEQRRIYVEMIRKRNKILR